MTTPSTLAPRWLRATLVALALTAATILALAPAGADTHTSHGWTYDTEHGVVQASPDAWHKGGDGTITVTLWQRDVRDGPQTRLYRVTIPNLVPVTVQLGVIPADACGGQWDVRDDATGVWLSGKQWQTPGCGGPTSTTTTTSPPTTTTSTSSTTTSPTTEPTTSTTTTEPTSSTTTTQPTTSTTTAPTTSTTTEPTWTTTSPPTTSTTSTEPSSSKTTTPVSSTTVADTSKPGTPPAATSNANTLPQTGGSPAWVGAVISGLLITALGVTFLYLAKPRGRYRR